MRRKGNRILKDVAVAICEYYQLNFSDYFESIEIVRPYALETLKATDAYYAQYSMRLYAMSGLSEILYPLQKSVQAIQTSRYALFMKKKFFHFGKHEILFRG